MKNTLYFLKVVLLSSMLFTPFIVFAVGLYYNIDATNPTSVFDFVDTNAVFGSK